MKVIIIGGGLAGLSAGIKLTENNEVIILEKTNSLGGLAGSFDYKDMRIPKHYHHIFAHDYVTHKYLKNAGLFENVNWYKIKMCIAVDGKKYDFTDPISLMKFNYLSILGRVRYGLFGAYAFTFMKPSKMNDDLDALKWLNKYAGKEVTEKLFYNLYARNKFNIPLSRISAKQFANRIKAKEALGKFMYPKNGLDKMIDYMKSEFVKKGGIIKKNFEIKKIDLDNKKVNDISYDKILVTIPIPEFLKVAKGVPFDYASRISKVKYCPCVTVVIGTDKLLGRHYWINVFNERIHMIMQHSILADLYDDKISWVLRYGGSEEDLDLKDGDIIEAYTAVVKKYFPEVEIKWSLVFREKYAEPVYDKDYASYMPNNKTPVEGLYFAGIATTYPKIRNMNTVLMEGENVAELINSS